MNITERLIASELNDEQTGVVLDLLRQYDIAARTLMRLAQAASAEARNTNACRDVYAIEQYAHELDVHAQMVFMGFAIAAKEKEQSQQKIKERPACSVLHLVSSNVH